MSRGTPGDNYNLKTAAIAAHDASYVLYRTGILSSGYATDASNVNFYNLTLNNKLHVKGDFQVDGSMTEIYSSRLDISDGLIELATSNTNDSIDIGFYGQYNGDKYTGLFRDKTLKSYQLFNNCSSRPDQAGVTAGSYEYANLALNDISLSTINGSQNGVLAINRSGVMTTVKGTLNVDEAVTLDDILTVAANKTTQLGGVVKIKGDVDTVAADAMTLGGSTATSIDIAQEGVITTVKGTLEVDQTLTVTQDASFNGDVEFNKNVDVSETLDVSGNTTIDGTLNVKQAVTLDAALAVTGGTSVFTLVSTGETSLATSGGVVNIASSDVMTTVKGTLAVTQDASFNGDVEFNKNVDVSETLDVSGNTTLGGTLDVSGNTTLGGDVEIYGDVDVILNPNASFSGALMPMTIGTTNATAITIGKANRLTTVKGLLMAEEEVQFNSKLDVLGALDVSGTLDVSGNTTLGGTLDVSGNITAKGDITAFYDQSDRRLKKNVETIDDALSIINNLRGVRFDWNEEAQKLNKNVDLNKRELGVIAQEIEKELPEVIKEGLGGYMAVRYEKITPLLIQCIKEQQTMIKQQDERISKLENSQN